MIILVFYVYYIMILESLIQKTDDVELLENLIQLCEKQINTIKINKLINSEEYKVLLETLIKTKNIIINDDLRKKYNNISIIDLLDYKYDIGYIGNVSVEEIEKNKKENGND